MLGNIAGEFWFWHRPIIIDIIVFLVASVATVLAFDREVRSFSGQVRIYIQRFPYYAFSLAFLGGTGFYIGTYLGSRDSSCEIFQNNGVLVLCILFLLGAVNFVGVCGTLKLGRRRARSAAVARGFLLVSIVFAMIVTTLAQSYCN